MPSKNISWQNESLSVPQVTNSNPDNGFSVNALVLTATKKSILTAIHSKTTQRINEPYKESCGSIQTNYTTQKLYEPYKNYETSGYLSNYCYGRTPLFPQCHAKEAPIPIMSSYDSPLTQHMDHSQMYHNRNIIESHEQTTRNKHVNVNNQRTYNN